MKQLSNEQFFAWVEADALLWCMKSLPAGGDLFPGDTGYGTALAPGQRCAHIYELINTVYAESRKRITTGMLNDLLNDATTRVQPPSDKGKRLKVYYMTQTSVAPPTFVIFCNSEELFHFSYRRYLENCIRDAFGFNGTPIRMVIRQRGDDSTGV